MLAWSAAEQLLSVVGKTSPCPPEWFKVDKVQVVVEHIRKVDPQLSFYDFVLNHLDPGNKGKGARKQLAAFICGEPFNPSYLASTVRHVFAHGTLTSTPKGVKAGAVEGCCNKVADLMLWTIDDKFAEMVAQAKHTYSATT